MTRNDQTGVLTPVAGSPFAPALLQTLDVQGRFLFGLGLNSIHMYQVNATTGAFAEVPNSPFVSANTNEPVFIAVEPSGKYIAVVNRVSPNAGQAQPIVLTSTGDQALSLTSISIGGANSVLVVMVTSAAASLGGCGGGISGALVTPPVITPAGTSTIVISPTAMSATGQPLQLPPIQLTLTVN
jgi:hypothetical protein